MTDNPRLQQLLDELLDSQSTPEDVCRSDPELLPEVRAYWREVRRVRSQLDTLFPAPPDAPASGALVASELIPFSSAFYSGTLLSQVYAGDPANPFGGLTFSYVLANNPTSLDALERFTAVNFTGFLADVKVCQDLLALQRHVKDAAASFQAVRLQEVQPHRVQTLLIVLIR